MIETEKQLTQAREALARLEGALQALQGRVGRKNRALFDAMAGDYWSSIASIRYDIDKYLGLVDSVQASVPLWMVLEGDSLQLQEISSRLLSEWLERFRKALFGVTAYYGTGQPRLGGRPEATLLQMTDPLVMALSPGSIKVGMRLPEAPHEAGELGPAEEAVPLVYRALERLLAVASWASSRDLAAPLGISDDTDELSVIAHYAATLAPTPRSAVRIVAFSGALVPSEDTLRLNVESRQRLQGLVRLLSHVNEEIVHGVIREIDLDAQRVTLRERGPGLSDLKCRLQHEHMEYAQAMLNQSVTIRGLVSSATPETIDVIEITEGRYRS